MSDELQRCPDCGAYVMGGDSVCPRCDANLQQAAPPDAAPEDDTRDPDETEILPAPSADDDATVIADLDAAEPADPEAAEMHLPTAIDLPAATSPSATAETPAATETSPAAKDADAPPPTTNVPPVTEILPDAVAESGAAEDDDPESGPAAETAAPAAEEESAPESESEAEPGDPARTQPGTNNVVPVKEPLLDAGEMPTMQMGDLDEDEAETATADTAESTDSAEAMHSTLPATGTPAPEVPERAAYIVPPAPYTAPPVPAPPPPANITPPPAPYAPPQGYYAQQQQPPGYDPALAYVQQRVNTYRHGGYRVETHGQYEASLRYGKRLTVGTLLLALVTLIGALWYLVILAISGFTADTVYVVLENDGRVYEDGPGAAHIRRQRSRTGRRWSVFGLMIFFVSLLLAIPLGLVAGVVLTQERYQAALREAYPAVTLFEEQFSNTEAAPDDVDLAKNGAVAFAVAGVLTLVGLWGGLTLFVIGTVHASAYRVRVPPLPGWA